MKKIINPVARFIMVAIFTLSLTSCSTHFTYNNIGWLSSFWIDDYVDLNKQQAKEFKQLVVSTRDWHRQTQLPLYKQDLIALQQLFHSQPSAQALIDHFGEAKQHWQQLLDVVTPSLIPLAESLTQQQKQQFIDQLSEEIADELEEYQEQTQEQWRTDRLERQRELYSDWLGKLNKEQESLIAAANMQYINSKKLWLDYKSTRLDALKALFLSDALPQTEFRKELTHIIHNREAFMSEALINADAMNQQSNVALMLAIGKTMTAKQWQHLDDEFADYIEEIDGLINSN